MCVPDHDYSQQSQFSHIQQIISSNIESLDQMKGKLISCNRKGSRIFLLANLCKWIDYGVKMKWWILIIPHTISLLWRKYNHVLGNLGSSTFDVDSEKQNPNSINSDILLIHSEACPHISCPMKWRINNKGGKNAFLCKVVNKLPTMY